MLWANIYIKSLCPLLNCKLKFILIFRDYVTHMTEMKSWWVSLRENTMADKRVARIMLRALHDVDASNYVLVINLRQCGSISRFLFNMNHLFLTLELIYCHDIPL